ncbi:DUF29 domain-containing protein [Pannus brasiliensis CCIBt3594]|uniref:DUF29 domain-containing protein n=1 Tax=Pannus brasiliensis CCIBt3594 TaxID=1427578 RepID=A0AAW9QWK3_9CHRO
MADTLYDRDLQLWIDRTIEQLQQRDFESLDIEHLIEELVDSGKSEKNGLTSNLRILLCHLLKVRVQRDAPETMTGSWYSSILEHRQRVLDNVNNTPSLKSFLSEAIEIAYPDVRKLAIKEGKLARFGVRVPAESEYPSICPFSIDRILDEDFFGV